MSRSVILALLLLSSVPAFAQTSPSSEDLLALNRYLQQGDNVAINAELRRLRVNYPQWVPPPDLKRLSASTVPQSAIEQFYRQVAAGQVGMARETLINAQRDYPAWTPSADMLAQLEATTAQNSLDSALQADDIEAARALAARTPGLLNCTRINNAWQIAEGQQAAGARGEALATYRAILSACTDPGDLVSTIEKANAVASEAELRTIVAQVSGRFPSEAGGFDAVLQRLLAGRHSISSAPVESSGTVKKSAPKVRVPIPAARTSPQPRLEGSPKRATSGESPSQCAARTAGARNAAMLLERAWCVYNMERTMDAMADFRAALGGRLSTHQRRDAQYGLALSYLKMGMSEPAAQIAATTDFDQRQRVDIERQILNQRGVQAYKERRFRDAIRYFDAIEQVNGSIRRDLAILRAYAYLNAGQRPRALSEFRRINNDLSTSESRRGLQAASD